MDVFDETQNRTEDDYLGIRGELAKYLDGNAKEEHARGSNGYDADQINANGHGNGDDAFHDENDESHDEDFEDYGEGELLGGADSGPRVVELEAERDSVGCEDDKSQEPQKQGSAESDEKRSLEYLHDAPAEEDSSLREREEITISKAEGELQREGLEEYSRHDDSPGAGSCDVSCDEEEGGEGEMGAQAGGDYEGIDEREEAETDEEEDTEEMRGAREEEEEGATGELGVGEGQTGTEMNDESQEEEEGDEDEEDEGRSEETGFGGVQAGAEIKGGKQEEEEEDEEKGDEEEDDEGDDGEDDEEDMAMTTEENREQLITEGESGDQYQEDQSGIEATETQAAEENEEDEESEEAEGEEGESGDGEGEEEGEIEKEDEEGEIEKEDEEGEIEKEDEEVKAAMRKEEETGNAKIRMEIASNEDLRRTTDGPQKDKVAPAYRRQFFHSDTTSSISSMHVNAPSPQTSDITDSSSDESDVRRGAYSPRSDLEEAADGGDLSPPETTPNGRGSAADWPHEDWAGQVIAIKCSGKMFNGGKAAAETIPSVYVSREYDHDDEEALPSDGDDPDVTTGGKPSSPTLPSLSVHGAHV